MTAPSDAQESSMAVEGRQGVLGREVLTVFPGGGRGGPPASGSPYMTEWPSSILPGSGIKLSRPPWIWPGTSPLWIVTTASIRRDDKGPSHLQEDHNQWTGEPQTPVEISVETETYHIKPLFQMILTGTISKSPVKMINYSQWGAIVRPHRQHDDSNDVITSIELSPSEPDVSLDARGAQPGLSFLKSYDRGGTATTVSPTKWTQNQMEEKDQSKIKNKNKKKKKPTHFDKEDLGGLQGDSDYTDWDDPLTGVPCHFNREDPLPEVSSHFDRDDPIPGVPDHFVWDDPCGNSHDYLDWDDPPGDSLSIQYNMSLAEATGAPLRHSRVNSIEP